MTVIIFIVMLAVLVLVHEFGHFIVAKSSGIRVDEFGLGFPPRIAGIKKGETVYSLNWIPFGGFVKIFGENGETSANKMKGKRSFANASKWVQAFILIAGILFNIIFAWILLSIGFMFGMPVPQDYALSNTTVTNVAVTITSVSPGSPADKAGLKVGDQILNMTAEQPGQENQPDQLLTYSIQSVQDFVASHPGETISLTYRRGNITPTVMITPESGIFGPTPAIGVALDMFGILKLAPPAAVWQGAKLTYTLVEDTAIGLSQFLYQAVTGKAQLSEVTGPVGIAGLVGDAAHLGFVYLLSFTAFISINLAIINLIPFPALDGGRLLFVIIEKIKGSAINPKISNYINSFGFALLLLLMLVVTYHDILQLVH